MSDYDAVLLLSFGGPEKPEDVMPFLENVTRGRGIPRERLEEVAEHYHHFGGRSPINDQNRSLLAALRAELATSGIYLPVYWGNRNWHPFLSDTLRQMKQDGVRRAMAFVTSAFSSYSGCRQYREDIIHSREEIGEDAPEIDKVRVFYDHPKFRDVIARETSDAFTQLPESVRDAALLMFSAHSVPLSMSNGARYVPQLEETSRFIAETIGRPNWRLVYQSRSGPPQVPWLEPDILDSIREEHTKGTKALVIVPIGFVSDHMEVMYDLDTEAKDLCDSLGMPMARAATAGDHPSFVGMIRELIEERLAGGGIVEGLCTPECCPAPKRKPF